MLVGRSPWTARDAPAPLFSRRIRSRPEGLADVPRVLVCLEGEGKVEHGGFTFPVGKGDVWLLPAVVGACPVQPRGAVSLLEIALRRGPMKKLIEAGPRRHRRFGKRGPRDVPAHLTYALNSINKKVVRVLFLAMGLVMTGHAT
jgi:hypothetical protein